MGGKCIAALPSTNEEGCGLFLKSYWCQLWPIIVPHPKPTQVWPQLERF